MPHDGRVLPLTKPPMDTTAAHVAAATRLIHNFLGWDPLLQQRQMAFRLTLSEDGHGWGPVQIPWDDHIEVYGFLRRGGPFGDRRDWDPASDILDASGIHVEDGTWDQAFLTARWGWGWERHLQVTAPRGTIVGSLDTVLRLDKANSLAGDIPEAGDILCLDIGPPARAGDCEAVLVESVTEASGVILVTVTRGVAGLHAFTGVLSSANVERVHPPEDLASVCGILARRIADQEQRALQSSEFERAERGLLFDLTRRLAPYRRRLELS